MAEVLKQSGKPRHVRLTLPRIVARVQKLRASFAGVAVCKLSELRAEADPAERLQATEDIERLHAMLGTFAKTLHDPGKGAFT